MRLSLSLLCVGALPRSAVAEADCSNASGLQARIAGAFTEDGRTTSVGLGLSGVVDNVLSPEACVEAVDALSSKFGRGFDGYGGLQAPAGFTALGLKDLASLMTEPQYRMLLGLRERSRAAAEEALGMCPGTLAIDFTHFTQKAVGGKHDFHADNCFAVPGDSATPASPVAVCDRTTKTRWGSNGQHPYPGRVAASILFLNEDFEGGEFFLADQRTGAPRTLVRGRAGRMVVFTSGPESIHGALPPTPREGREEARRLAIAVWFVIANQSNVEPVPSFLGTDASPQGQGRGGPEL